MANLCLFLHIKNIMSRDNIHIPSVIFAILLASFIIIMMWKNKPEKPMPKALSLSIPPPFLKGEARRGSSVQPTTENVWHYIQNHCCIIFDSLVYKKVIKETGLTARWLKQNNLTCMRFPKKRATTAIGEHDGYAVYSSWQSCIDDYALFQTMFHGKTIEDYYDFLRNYGDSNYVKILRIDDVPFPK